MKVLHLYSDWKWTGPAEPALELAVKQRDRGIDVRFICGAPPAEAEQSILESSRRRDFPVETSLHLRKHRNPIAGILDRRALAPRIRREGFEIVHVHRTPDHIVGGRAARASGSPARVIRTIYDPGLPAGRGIRRLIGKFTDGVIALSPVAAEEVRSLHPFGGPAVAHIPGAVNLDRFRPDADGSGIRAEIGIAPGSPVAGVVARIQPHRRFEVLLPALRAAHESHPDLRAVIYGRGSRRHAVAMRPVEEMGLGEVIRFPGYRDRDYVEALAAIDFLIYLVPGSDGSCRAALQAMALGKPVIAARRGMLPHIVDHERTGLVIEDTVENLTDAILRLARDRGLREKLGAEAARQASTRFDLKVQAERVIAFYEDRIAAM